MTAPATKTDAARCSTLSRRTNWRSNPTHQHGADDHPGCQNKREDTHKQRPRRKLQAGRGVRRAPCSQGIVVRLWNGHDVTPSEWPSRRAAQVSDEKRPKRAAALRNHVLLQCAIYAAVHNKASSKRISLCMAAMQRQDEPAMGAREAFETPAPAGHGHESKRPIWSSQDQRSWPAAV